MTNKPIISIIATSEASQTLAHRIGRAVGGTLVSRADVGSLWKQTDAFVFIGAMGICVRTIAPYVNDKHSDPAVVCVDSLGRSVISVLSGHVGGANEPTQQVAAALGATPVITTQSDLQQLWPLDLLPQRFSWAVKGELNPAIFAFVDRRPTALLIEHHDRGTDELERTCPDFVEPVGSLAEVSSARHRLLILVSYRHYPPAELPAGVQVLQYVPRVLTVGIGLAHQAAAVERILSDIPTVMQQQGLEPLAISTYATIDVKADEPVVRRLQADGQRVVFYTAEELQTVDVPTPSEVVSRHVGTPSVSEAAALLASNVGLLLMPKHKSPEKDFTLAVAAPHPSSATLHHHPIEIVGAGPGDPELISVRGRRLLEQADLILYAGSLVPRELTDCHKPGATIRSSASMALEEQCALMKDYYDRGLAVVRLHTGDPCIFGAIQEQMAFFDRNAMDYHITPGISSFLAAAAELRSQFTIPERTQTIILTRGEGRTPMPER